jgi:asparagine synthase (glutamine-hydrolysing)
MFMCGIAGYWQSGGFSDEEAKATVDRMAQQIVHRGPDDGGVWVEADSGLALAHRRLSILDLSPAGHQPMVSVSRRYVLVFNGEIYNHLELRQKLVDFRWRGYSDTETLLAGFEAWGIEATLKKTVGMFAIALWDRVERVLTLSRDRMGEKPLFYGWQGETFLFGSELKALKVHPAFQGNIYRDSLTLLLRYNYIPAPYSIYEGISKLPAGTLLHIPVGRGMNAARGAIPQTYWSLRKVVSAGQVAPFVGSENEVVDALEQRLKNSIGLQMVADVPLGAFLSGGVDSSLVVALMQEQSNRPVKTFSIGFSEKMYNEAGYAKAVAKHLKTDHTELYVSPKEAMAVIPQLPKLYDEPFSDSSQVPTFLVSQLARQHVTVSLSGDSGDELFCGYNRYLLADRLWNRLSLLPVSLRRTLAAVVTTISPAAWSTLFGFLNHGNIGDKFHKAAGVLSSSGADDLYFRLISHWQNPESVVLNGVEPMTLLTGGMSDLSHLNQVQKMMLLDLVTYLPDDILTKVDRAAMGVSLETRVPFLDHKVVEFAWRMPMEFKIRNGESKWALRQILYKYVPKELIERPKMGFGVPIDVWLRGPLRDWAESLLSESRLRQEGFFNPVPIRHKWEEHLSGKRNWQYQLWDVLMFQAWLESQ